MDWFVYSWQSLKFPRSYVSKIWAGWTIHLLEHYELFGFWCTIGSIGTRMCNLDYTKIMLIIQGFISILDFGIIMG